MSTYYYYYIKTSSGIVSMCSTVPTYCNSIHTFNVKKPNGLMYGDFFWFPLSCIPFTEYILILIQYKYIAYALFNFFDLSCVSSLL